jgi:hypothetical protein
MPLPLPLNEYPVVLCGPILRRVERMQVSVWLALRRPYQLSLVVKKASNPTVPVLTLRPPTTTVRVGLNLFISVVTAEAASTVDQLSGDEIYFYDVEFSPVVSGDPDGNFGSPGIVVPMGTNLPADRLSYESLNTAFPAFTGKPSFSLPSAQIANLNVAHGSWYPVHRPASGAELTDTANLACDV